jgi:hypothetical protein
VQHLECLLLRLLLCLLLKLVSPDINNILQDAQCTWQAPTMYHDAGSHMDNCNNVSTFSSAAAMNALAAGLSHPGSCGWRYMIIW